ncbi:MAG TPA: hypothetical protein VGY51_13390, partial [Acidimicrobiales bacterium]|nr:hypothetical protein [Acidimicrobiales bacterium]
GPPSGACAPVDFPGVKSSTPGPVQPLRSELNAMPIGVEARVEVPAFRASPGIDQNRAVVGQRAVLSRARAEARG